MYETAAKLISCVLLLNIMVQVCFVSHPAYCIFSLPHLLQYTQTVQLVFMYREHSLGGKCWRWQRTNLAKKLDLSLATLKKIYPSKNTFVIPLLGSLILVFCSSLLLFFSHEITSDSLQLHGLTVAHQPSSISWNLHKFMSIKSVMREFCQNHIVVAMLHPTLCDRMDCSTPGSSVLHYLLEFAQIYIHWVGDAL